MRATRLSSAILGCRRRWLLAALMAAVVMAGCIADDTDSAGEGSLVPASLDEALLAPGISLGTIEGGDGPVAIKLLEPSSEQVDTPGKQPIVLLVHDRAAGEPVEDAMIHLQARMPGMGHGTGPEEDPTHVADGIYEGLTTWSMAGGWELHLDVELSDGSNASYVSSFIVGEHGDVVRAQAQDPYDDFGDAMGAPGTVYEGTLVAPANDTSTHSEEITGPYEERLQLTTQQRPLQELRLTAELSPGTPADRLNLTLVDPEGQAQATVDLTAGQPVGEIVLEAAEPGDWSLEVAGHALEASFQVELEAVYVAPHVDVKTLDPIDPTRAVTGDRPFLFLVFDAVEPAPVTDAEITYASWPSEEDETAVEGTEPRGEGHGQYAAASGFTKEGAWHVQIDVLLPTGEAYRFLIQAHAYPPGEVPADTEDTGSEAHDHEH